MKILVIHQYFLEKDDPGGSRFNEMVKVWVKDGHEVEVLCGMLNYVTGKIPEKYKGEYINQSEYEPNLRVIRSRVSAHYNESFLGRLWAYFSFVLSSILAGIFYTQKTDVIVVTSPPLFVGITAIILSWVKRRPFIFEVRDLWPESAIDTGVVTNKWVIKFAYWFESYVYKKASLINVLTPAFRTKLVESKNVSPSKVIYIPNAADFSLTDQLVDVFDEEAFRVEKGLVGKYVVTYVGAHGVANHLEQLLEAASYIADQDVIIQLIGSGMEKKRLMALADKMSLNNVRFVDSVPKDQVFKYILASDIGVSVLKNIETFKTVYSNKTFDYMACKKPILMGIDGVSRALVEQANCGVYVEPENAQAIADAISHAKSNIEEYVKKGNNGYLFARKNFDRKKLAKDYLIEIKKISENF